jgi:hypothetical protein
LHRLCTKSPLKDSIFGQAYQKIGYGKSLDPHEALMQTGVCTYWSDYRKLGSASAAGTHQQHNVFVIAIVHSLPVSESYRQLSVVAL